MLMLRSTYLRHKEYLSKYTESYRHAMFRVNSKKVEQPPDVRHILLCFFFYNSQVSTNAEEEAQWMDAVILSFPWDFKKKNNDASTAVDR